MKNLSRVIALFVGFLAVSQLQAMDKLTQVFSAQAGLCGLYSNGTKYSNALVPGLKEAGKEVCCRFNDWKSRNPNAVSALDGCQGVATTNKLDMNAACAFVALAGRFLDKLPAAAKSLIAGKCCQYTDLMGRNPNASRALGC